MAARAPDLAQEGRERLRAARTTHGGYGADTRAFLSSVNALLAQAQAPRSAAKARSPEAETSEGVNRALEQLGARSPEAQTSGGVNRALPPRGIPDAKPQQPAAEGKTPCNVSGRAVQHPTVPPDLPHPYSLAVSNLPITPRTMTQPCYLTRPSRPAA